LFDAFRMLLVRVAAEKALPFEPLTPNQETIDAIKAARRGELVTAGSTDELIASLVARD
jgi:DNA-damage-inducible protein J